MQTHTHTHTHIYSAFHYGCVHGDTFGYARILRVKLRESVIKMIDLGAQARAADDELGDVTGRDSVTGQWTGTDSE